MQTFQQFMREMAYSTGSVPHEQRGVLHFDEVDKELFGKFSKKDEDGQPNVAAEEWLRPYGIKPKDSIASRVILARYGFLRPDLQELAKVSGVYFLNPETLMVGHTELPVNGQLVALENRIKGQIPQLVRWGGANPSADTGISWNRLKKGYIALDYHSKAHYQNDIWKELGFKSDEAFKKSFVYSNKNMNIPLNNRTLNTKQLKDKIHESIEQRLPQELFDVKNDMIISISERVLLQIFLKLGKLAEIESEANYNSYLGMLIDNEIKQSIQYITKKGLRNAGNRANYFTNH